ncbi:MAG TPA: carbohydrate kinase family protein [Candidatus Competibacteraceae bacterium]|nr:carbohydrate kinase family protein [Candidatus Competibacteraceae bacterium]
MKALITGSVAYDVIMVFHDRFANHILPDKVHLLNVSFLVPELRREFGGCAGNIGYNLSLLGGEGYVMGSVGEDFGPYAAWMDRHGIDRRYVRIMPGSYTAQCYITTDLDDNQINAFHPGAMSLSHELSVPAEDGIGIGIVAPDGREGMLVHAEQFAAAGIPFLFDPGQQLPRFDGTELLRFLDQARWLAVNDYEGALLAERTGLTLDGLAERVEALIVTRGAEGSHIYLEGGRKRLTIPAARAERLADPTGCGDAYRAGLLYGLMHGLDWETTGRIASLMGAIKIEEHGTQNHRFTLDEFRARFRENFGYEF